MKHPHAAAMRKIIAALFFVLMGNAVAQTQYTLTTLTNFTTNSGITPSAALTVGPDGNFYGVTEYGGNFLGSIFRATTNGTLTSLHSFSGANGDGGANPLTSLTVGPDGNLYGTTTGGGTLQASNTFGTIFRITPTGDFTNLFKFNTTNGAYPGAALALGPDDNFYGTTEYGGISNNGTIFKVTTNGVLTTLYQFTGGLDECAPVAGLVLGKDGNFYGTTTGYPKYGNFFGTIFRVSPNGGFTTLYTFTNPAFPCGTLVLGLDGNFYGTTSGVSNGVYVNNGTIFRMTTNGSMTTLYSFPTGSNGIGPYSGLVIGPGGNFYGTTQNGGLGLNNNGGYGTVYQITTNGAFQTVYYFTNGADGNFPSPGLTLGPDGDLYGVTEASGSNSIYYFGTIYRLSIAASASPLMAITVAGTNVILTWPATFTNFTVQATDDLLANGLWTNVPQLPLLLNGQNIVTNHVVGSKMFYRLSR